MAYLMALFCAPVVGMVSYYLGLIVMTKAKIKQTDHNFMTHFLRIVFGLLVLSGVALFFLMILYAIT